MRKGEIWLAKTSAADTFQIRSVSTERFVSRLGFVVPGKLEEILEAIQVVIGR